MGYPPFSQSSLGERLENGFESEVRVITENGKEYVVKTTNPELHKRACSALASNEMESMEVNGY